MIINHIYVLQLVWNQYYFFFLKKWAGNIFELLEMPLFSDFLTMIVSILQY